MVRQTATATLTTIYPGTSKRDSYYNDLGQPCEADALSHNPGDEVSAGHAGPGTAERTVGQDPATEGSSLRPLALAELCKWSISKVSCRCLCWSLPSIGDGLGPEDSRRVDRGSDSSRVLIVGLGSDADNRRETQAERQTTTSRGRRAHVCAYSGASRPNASLFDEMSEGAQMQIMSVPAVRARIMMFALPPGAKTPSIV